MLAVNSENPYKYFLYYKIEQHYSFICQDILRFMYIFKMFLTKSHFLQNTIIATITSALLFYFVISMIWVFS